MLDLLWFLLIYYAIFLPVAMLATWRLAAALYYEYGPFDIWLNLRTWAEQNSHFWNKQLNCFWCCSILVSPLVVVVYLVAPCLLLPLAFSGAAILLSQGGRLIWREMVEN